MMTTTTAKAEAEAATTTTIIMTPMNHSNISIRSSTGTASRSTSTSSTTTTISKLSSSLSLFDELSDDVMGRILLFCDFVSAVRFCQSTSKALRQRYYHYNYNYEYEYCHQEEDIKEETKKPSSSSSSTSKQVLLLLHHVWKEMYHRHGFAPLQPKQVLQQQLQQVRYDSVQDYITETWMRRQLFNNLFQQRHKQQKQPQQQLVKTIKDNKKNKNKKQKLQQQQKQQRLRQCFNLPHRYFSFLPILPNQHPFDDNNDDDDDDDDLLIPPLYYECDSFVLTSCGTGSELLLLNPYDGTLHVIQDIRSKIIQNSMSLSLSLSSPNVAMAKKTVTTSSTPTNKKTTTSIFVNNNDDDNDDDDSMFYYSKSKKHQQDDKASKNNNDDNNNNNNNDKFIHKNNNNDNNNDNNIIFANDNDQCLLDSEEYFQFDIAPYFPNRQSIQLSEEYEMRFMGIDAKPIFLSSSLSCGGGVDGDSRDMVTVVGTMVGIGRCVQNVQNDHIVCTELSAWTKQYDSCQHQHQHQYQQQPQQQQAPGSLLSVPIDQKDNSKSTNNYNHDKKKKNSNNNINNNNKYGNKLICRFPWTFYLVDMDAQNQRFFVSFHKGDGPYHERKNETSATTTTETVVVSSRRSTSTSTSTTPSSHIVVYPMVPVVNENDDNDNDNNNKYNDSSFPDPLFTIECGDSVASFIVNSTGDRLLVSTKSGMLQIWNVATTSTAAAAAASTTSQHQIGGGSLVQMMNIREALKESILNCFMIRNTKSSSRGKTGTRQTTAMEKNNYDSLAAAPIRLAAASPTTASHVNVVVADPNLPGREVPQRLPSFTDNHPHDGFNNNGDNNASVAPAAELVNRDSQNRRHHHHQPQQQQQQGQRRFQQGQDDASSATNIIGDNKSVAAALASVCCPLYQQVEAAARFRAPADSIFVSKHSPTFGFVTLQRHRDEGTSLLFWQNGKVVSLINLPLIPHRVPRVFFEGGGEGANCGTAVPSGCGRLIVFGEDHIGMIILVYSIGAASGGDYNLFSNDGGDDDNQKQYHPQQNQPTIQEESGGVYNLTDPPMIHFANRIRHVALGGIDSFDSIHMTCNERFLIVNTRTGNHLVDARTPDGLLVIDLQDGDGTATPAAATTSNQARMESFYY